MGTEDRSEQNKIIQHSLFAEHSQIQVYEQIYFRVSFSKGLAQLKIVPYLFSLLCSPHNSFKSICSPRIHCPHINNSQVSYWIFPPMTFWRTMFPLYSSANLWTSVKGEARGKLHMPGVLKEWILKNSTELRFHISKQWKTLGNFQIRKRRGRPAFRLE